MNAEDTNSTGRPPGSGKFDPELSPAQFETEFWGRILQRRPYYEDVLRRQAEGLARAGRHEELLPLDLRLVELRPQDAVVHYNLCCTLARLGRTQDALAALRRAIELGYDDVGHLETDPDLDSLRDLAEYRALLRRWRVRG